MFPRKLFIILNSMFYNDFLPSKVDSVLCILSDSSHHLLFDILKVKYLYRDFISPMEPRCTECLRQLPRRLLCRKH